MQVLINWTIWRDGVALRFPLCVDVWRIRISDQDEQKDFAILSKDEVIKANGFYRFDDRRRSIVARAALRRLISRYLGVEPMDLSFEVNAFGKPFLASPFRNSRLTFSVAHSGDWVLLAFARNVDVGVDVESLLSGSNIESISDTILSPSEVQVLLSAPISEHRTILLRSWTCKEAIVKALGVGLAHAPRDLIIDFASKHPRLIASGRYKIDNPNDWRLRCFSVDPRCLGGLAVRSRDIFVEFRSW